MNQTNDRWENQFLSWFPTLNIPMLERKLNLGGLELFNFVAGFKVADGRIAAAFGTDPSRSTAALKCAAEAVERQTMMKFFSKNGQRFPKAFCNSNGWALQRTAELARQSAIAEATERHLLLLSFLKFGWAGFLPVTEIDAGSMKLRLFQTVYTSDGQAAGFVMAQGSVVPGVSFGHCLLPKAEADAGRAWQSAIFEAGDKLLLFDRNNATPDPKSSWVQHETFRYLLEAFAGAALEFGAGAQIPIGLGQVDVEIFDLKNEYVIDFPLYAAFAHGLEILPLFWKAELDEAANKRLKPILDRYEIESLPDRHPIL